MVQVQRRLNERTNERTRRTRSRRRSRRKKSMRKKRSRNRKRRRTRKRRRKTTKRRREESFLCNLFRRLRMFYARKFRRKWRAPADLVNHNCTSSDPQTHPPASASVPWQTKHPPNAFSTELLIRAHFFGVCEYTLTGVRNSIPMRLCC